jgi:regulator of replication initiation timing
MADIDERLERIEQAVKTTNEQLGDLKERHGQMLERHGRMLTHHGRLLNQIVSDLGPLKALPDFVKRVADDHELRIAALEKKPSGS